jgi:predicted amidohydrolase
MALVDTALSASLKAIFDAMAAAASGTPKDNQWYADQLAKAIDNQIKTAVVSTTVTGSVTSGEGSGGSVVGSGTGSLS